MDRHVVIFSEAQIRSVSPEMSNFPLLHSTGPMTFGSNKLASGELVTYDAPGGAGHLALSLNCFVNLYGPVAARRRPLTGQTFLFIEPMARVTLAAD